jgi:ribokinase
MRSGRPIAVVGSVNVDLTTFAANFPKPGETVFGDRFDLGWGGKGANQAVAARLCGAEVSMVARVGDDLFGPRAIDNLASHGIDTSHVRRVPGVSSGVAPIFVEPNGENRILVIKGANDHLTADDVDLAAPMLAEAACIVLQFEIPLDVVHHTIHFARQHRIPCIVNPAPARRVDLSGFAGVGYFLPNETEAEAFTGLSVGSVDQATACAEHLVAMGLRTVIITLGAQGALLARDGHSELISTYDVIVKDTSGAGDAFVGSFAAFLSEGLPERDAIARANLYAALSTMSVGTQKSFVTRERFEAEWQQRRAFGNPR